MTFFKKAVAVFFMVLSALAIIAMIVGLVGSWIVKAQVETTAIQLLLSGEAAITTAREGMGRVDGLLNTSTQFVGEVDARFREIGTDIQQNESIVLSIVERVNGDIVPAIQQAVETFRVIEANLVALNDAIEAVKGIPFLNLENRMPEIAMLEQMLGLMERLRTDVEALRDTLRARREELIDGRIEQLVTMTGNLKERLTSTAAMLAETDQRLEETAATMRNLRERLPRLLTIVTVILNVFFLLSLFAFISLFTHAYAYYKCTEDGLRGLLPGECEAEKAIPAVT